MGRWCCLPAGLARQRTTGSGETGRLSVRSAHHIIAASQWAFMDDAGCGPWPCQNAAEEALADRDSRIARQRDGFEQISFRSRRQRLVQVSGHPDRPGGRGGARTIRMFERLEALDQRSYWRCLVAIVSPPPHCPVLTRQRYSKAPPWTTFCCN